MQILQLDRALDGAIASYRLLDHPFYRRWEAGALERHELAAYAGQYRHFEARLPAYLGTLADALPAGPARSAVLDNLADETGDPVPHLELFDRFAEGVGGVVEPAGPAATRLAEAYEAALGAGAPSGLAGLLAYERQAPEVAASKADGLRTHYGLSPSATAFWDHHATVDLRHARWATEALASLDPDSEVVARAARTVAAAWWGFLDEREACAA